MTFKGVCVAALAAVTALAISAGGGLAKGPPYKVYLSLSYTGNDWQSEAENMIRALAASDRMKDKVKLEVEVSGPNAQKQSQQINAMVQAGADAIIMYGSSETLLNGAIKNACDKGVVVVAYELVRVGAVRLQHHHRRDGVRPHRRRVARQGDA